jgi:hypothetical protein
VPSADGAWWSGSALGLFLDDLRNSCGSFPQHDAESCATAVEIAKNYLHRLSQPQVVRLIGVLILHTYHNDSRAADMGAKFNKPSDSLCPRGPEEERTITGEKE